MRIILSITAAILVFANAAHADIYQWEYVNPADPSQGRQQSKLLAPDGAGVDAVPGANLSGRNLTMAYLVDTDFSAFYGCNFYVCFSFQSDLSSAILVDADLSNANFSAAILTDADFTNANVTGASFRMHTCEGLFGCRIAGTGITPSQLYTTASYQAHDLSGVDLSFHSLVAANFTGQNLTNASFSASDLTDVDFTDAEIRGASFGTDPFFSPHGTGIDPAQLYSTASYKFKDMHGVILSNNNLAFANFIGQNLTNAAFDGSTLTGANFTGAEVRGANFGSTTSTGFTLAQLYSTTSYQAHDLTGIYLAWNDLSGASFAGQDLRDARLHSANLSGANFREANLTGATVGGTLTGADFTDAEVRGTSLYGLTPAQLYSTSSYKSRTLMGIQMPSQDVSGWNFAGQNLTNAYFNQATLSATDFRQANLTNASLYLAELVGADFTNAVVRGAALSEFTLDQLYSTASYQSGDLRAIGLYRSDLAGGDFSRQDLTNAAFLWSTVAGADFTSADTRGALYFLIEESTTTTNLIRPDGHIDGLVLDDGGLLMIRDYDGDFRYEPAQRPIPITVDEHLAMAPGGTLRMAFEADAWDSTISFAPGIPVTLGGTLELTFADDVNLASQIGRTLDLFDWTGVTPTGVFDVASPYGWDLSNLYTTGEVTLLAVPEPSGLLLITCVLAAVAMCRAKLHPGRAPTIAASIPFLVLVATSSQADIYQWEYINPADPSQGKRQSTTLAPDGTGVDAVPGANLSNRNLSKAYLNGAQLNWIQQSSCHPAWGCQYWLVGASFGNTNLTDGDLQNADLSGAWFVGANLTGADLSGAQVQGANFSRDLSNANATGISLAQLYSTASYQARDLSGIVLKDNDLSGGNFAGQNLSNASFSGATVTDADFEEANLTNASFYGAAITDADFTGANILGASFGKGGEGSGITPAQIYSTASYQARDLRGIDLRGNDLSGINFTGQKLTAALLHATLVGADFTAADIRRSFVSLEDLAGATTTNMIWRDGHINGLNLDAQGLLVVRDDRYLPQNIIINQNLEMDPGATLRMVFGENYWWASTISFAPGIPVTLGGTLELTFADDVNLASQIGRAFDLFDWAGVIPSGTFAVSSPYAWDTSSLYTTGEITLTALPEPSCGALALCGLIAVVLWRRH